MASLNYNEVYSRFFSRVQAYDFLSITEEELNEFLNSWLHSAMHKPYIRKLFKTIRFDDEVQSIEYEMSYNIDEYSDKEFIIEVGSLGIAIQWLEPKINNVLNIVQFFGSKEEKMYSQAAHLKETMALRDSFKKEQRQIITDRGYMWNTYLYGE